MKNRYIRPITTYVVLAFYLAVAFGIVLFIFSVFPFSYDSDTFGHLFKINFLNDSIEQGNWYPLYTKYWYNGMELFRYWPPLSYYLFVLLQHLLGADVVNTFYIFAAFSFFVTMLCWLPMGVKENRIGLSFVLGLLYFFCPDNLRVFFGEGNIPRILVTAILPLVFFCVWDILRYRQYKMYILLSLLLWVIIATHARVALMTGVAIFIYSQIYCMIHKQGKQLLYMMLNLFFTELGGCVILYPAYTGSILAEETKFTMNQVYMWVRDAVITLNPFLRQDYDFEFYFGLSIFCIIIIGIITADKKTAPGFWTALVIYMGTTTTAGRIVELLPFKEIFLMQQFVPMAMCAFIISMLVWKRLRKPFLVLFSILIVIDFLPTFRFVENRTQVTAESFLELEAEKYLLDEAKEITQNRLGIWDGSAWNAAPSYYLSNEMDEDSVDYSFGWDIQGAKTVNNIIRINEAVDGNYFGYAFDRALELGDDTLLISKALVGDVDGMQQAAQSVGYQLINENDYCWLYHIDTGGTYGTRKQYRCLAIGEHAHIINYIYPQFGAGDSTVLEDYTIEELAQYEKLYLSGFTYRNKAAAEALIEEAANRGVKVYIEMQHVPTDKLQGKAEFLGVYAQFITFTEKFPILATDNGSQFKLEFGTAGYEVWNTVYLSGLDNVMKYSYYDANTSLAYLGTAGNDNIIFMGFNTLYYYIESKLPRLLTFLNEVFDEEPGEVVETEIIPISIEYQPRQIIVESGYDDVNINLADLDCLERADGEAKKSTNNLLVVDNGRIVYNINVRVYIIGGIISIFGIAGLVIFWSLLFRFHGKGRMKENEEVQLVTSGDNDNLQFHSEPDGEGSGNSGNS